MSAEKTIGRVAAQLLNELYKQGKIIFSIEDAIKILKSNYLATAKLLSRMTSRNTLMRIKLGKYIIVPQEISGEYIGNWYVAAREMANDKKYFISHYSAMDIHNMTTQPLTTVYISSSKRQSPPKNFKERFKFVLIKSINIWGVEENWVTSTEKVRVSNIEKTILDCLWQPQYAGGISEIAKGIWIRKDKINFPKLLSYVLKFNKYVVAKRLGFILETFGIGEKILSQLRKNINERYDLLDSNLPSKEVFKNKWHLIANINPEEFKAIIGT